MVASSSSNAALDADTFRAEYRRERIGARYLGPLHLVVTLSGALLGLVALVSQLHALRAVELVTVPCALLFANVVEYLVHRFLMHVPRPLVGFLYRRHTLEHHRFFVEGHMSFQDTRDWKAVLFPAPIIVFFFGGIALPVVLVLRLVLPENAALLFGASAVFYYLLYEVLHLLWHMPDAVIDRMVGVRRPLRALRRLHHRHHGDMQRGFNVTFPIADLLFRTM